MSTQGARAADVIATIEAQTEAAIARLRQVSALREELGAVRGTGSCDGVTVTVNASGVLLDADFGRAGLQGGAELRRRLLAAHRAAQRDVAAQSGLHTGPRLVPDDVSR